MVYPLPDTLLKVIYPGIRLSLQAGEYPAAAGSPQAVDQDGIGFVVHVFGEPGGKIGGAVGNQPGAGEMTPAVFPLRADVNDCNIIVLLKQASGLRGIYINCRFRWLLAGTTSDYQENYG